MEEEQVSIAMLLAKPCESTLDCQSCTSSGLCWFHQNLVEMSETATSCVKSWTKASHENLVWNIISTPEQCVNMKSKPTAKWIPGKKSNNSIFLNSDDYGPKDTTFHEQRSWRINNNTNMSTLSPEEEHFENFGSNSTWIHNPAAESADVLWIIFGAVCLVSCMLLVAVFFKIRQRRRARTHRRQVNIEMHSVYRPNETAV